MDDEEVNELVEGREKKRSSSFIRRAFKSSAKRCKWNFGFVLVFTDRQYELYSATRNDREQWVRVLSAIA